MKLSAIVLGGALLLAACASTPAGPVAEAPLLPEAAQAPRIVVAVQDLRVGRNPYALLQIDEYSAKTTAPGLAQMFEVREPTPNLLNRLLPGQDLADLAARAATAALRGEVPYRLALEAPGFRRLLVTPDGPGAAEVVTAVFPPGADPAAWAREQGAVTVLLRGTAAAETGRASSRYQPGEVRPVPSVWTDLVVRTDVVLQAEVRDAQGNLLFGGAKGVLGLRLVRPWSDVWMILPGVKTAAKLDEWAGSPAFRERMAAAVVQALGPVLPALAPHRTTEGF